MARKQDDLVEDIVQFDVSGEEVNEPGTRRECPVPKPGGIIGEVLGLKKPDPRTSISAKSTSQSPESSGT